MVFAMADVGADRIQTIRTLPAAKKWEYIDHLAQEAGFEGIFLTDSLYEHTLSMPLSSLPERIRRYRLFFFMERQYTLVSPGDAEALGAALGDALRFACDHGVLDVSLPPPLIPERMTPLRGFVREQFQEILLAWLPKYAWAGVTLSVESRIHGAQSVFQGLADYADFVVTTKGLGALIRVAEHCYDGYSENDLLEWIKPLPVSGFRAGDADPSLPREAGIGLPVGEGTVGLRRFLAPYRGARVYAALSINGTYEQIKKSAERLRERYV